MISIAYAHRMADAEKWDPIESIDATGTAVARNIRRLRGDMQYVKLAARLEDLGRPIPTLGLRKIESGGRRVDVDDLVALAVALEVSPETLLMPYAENADDEVQITGWHPMAAGEVWRWMQIDISSGWREFPRLSAEKALPAFMYRALMEEKAARMPALKAKFEENKRKYGLSDGDD